MPSPALSTILSIGGVAKALVAAVVPVILIQFGVTDADTIDQVVLAATALVLTWLVPNRG